MTSQSVQASKWLVPWAGSVCWCVLNSTGRSITGENAHLTASWAPEPHRADHRPHGSAMREPWRLDADAVLGGSKRSLLLISSPVMHRQDYEQFDPKAVMTAFWTRPYDQKKLGRLEQDAPKPAEPLVQELCRAHAVNPSQFAAVLLHRYGDGEGSPIPDCFLGSRAPKKAAAGHTHKRNVQAYSCIAKEGENATRVPQCRCPSACLHAWLRMRV